jgi:hypothetical protein
LPALPTLATNKTSLETAMRRLEKYIDRLGGVELLLVSVVVIGVPALFSALV